MQERVAVIGAILEDPIKSQSQFNKIVAEYHDLVMGRMGLPLKDRCMSVISITVIGTMDQINTMTGRLGCLQGVTVKTAISR
nr:TM1266 family iron-only hydrogenase system putative regulator [uncultured Peptostreptococcus sp.]